MSDIKVQSGTNDVGNTGGTDTGFTSVSALTAAFEYNSNNFPTHGGSTSSGGNMEGDDMSGHVELTGTGTLTFTRQSGSLAQNMRYDWQLIEYTGSGGGANEFIVRSRNTVALNGASSNTATLDTTPTDTSKCIPFITGVLTNDTGNGGEKLKAIAYINDSGDLYVERGQTGNNVTVQVVTVEFTGSNWSVYHGISTSSADTGSITLNTDSDGAGGSTGDVSDWSTAFIEGSFTTNDQGLDSVACRYDEGSGTTTVDWDFQSGNSSSHTHFVHVLQNDDMSVTRYTPSGSAANDTNVDVTSAGLTSLDTAMVIGTCQGSGGGTAYGRNWRNYRLTTTTNVQHYCHRSGNTINHNIQVIDFENVEDAGGVDDLLADDVESDSEVTTPDIGQDHALLADDVESDSEVSTPDVGQEHALLADDVESASEVSTPTLSESHVLLADDVESASEVSSPAVGQVHAITSDDIESASEVTTPSVGQEHALLSDSVESLSEASTPSVGQEHGLTANDAESASEAPSPAIGQEHALTAVSVESAAELTAPALTEVGPDVDALLADDVQSLTEVSIPALTEVVYENWEPTGGFLSPRDKQIALAHEEDELVIEFVHAFLEALTSEVH